MFYFDKRKFKKIKQTLFLSLKITDVQYSVMFTETRTGSALFLPLIWLVLESQPWLGLQNSGIFQSCKLSVVINSKIWELTDICKTEGWLITGNLNKVKKKKHAAWGWLKKTKFNANSVDFLPCCVDSSITCTQHTIHCRVTPPACTVHAQIISAHYSRAAEATPLHLSPRTSAFYKPVFWYHTWM